MTALRTSVTSLYEVSDIITDTSFRARDLVRGGDPILISQRSATRSLEQWDRIVARVVQVGSHAQISGAVLPYQRDASESVLKLFRNVAKRTDKERRKLANKVGGDVDHPGHYRCFLAERDASRGSSGDHYPMADRYYRSRGGPAGS